VFCRVARERENRSQESEVRSQNKRPRPQPAWPAIGQDSFLLDMLEPTVDEQDTRALAAVTGRAELA
jgi:hypothetical protein